MLIHNELKRILEKQLLRKPEFSEKWLEKYLVKEIAKRGGEAVKFFSAIDTGWMDRWILFKGHLFLCEMKSRNKKLEPRQRLKRRWAERKGFSVYRLHTKELVDEFLKTIDLL